MKDVPLYEALLASVGEKEARRLYIAHIADAKKSLRGIREQDRSRVQVRSLDSG